MWGQQYIGTTVSPQFKTMLLKKNGDVILVEFVTTLNQKILVLQIFMLIFVLKNSYQPTGNEIFLLPKSPEKLKTLSGMEEYEGV